MAKIGELIINLKANTAALSRGLSKAHKHTVISAQGMSQAIAKVGKAFLVAGGVIGAAAAVIIKKNIDMADRMAKLSRATNVTVEDLSRLQHVMKLGGIESEQFAKGVKKLNQSIFDNQRGLSTQRDAFEALGISQAELTRLGGNTTAVLFRMADAFADSTDKSQALAAMGQLLGQRVGPGLATAFAQGSKGLREMMSEADRLNLTISAETAAAAETFNDNMTRVQGALSGAGLTLTQHLLPTMNRFLVLIVATSRELPTLQDAVSDLAAGMLELQGKYNLWLRLIPGVNEKFREWSKEIAVGDKRTQTLTDTMLELQRNIDAAAASMGGASGAAGGLGDEHGKTKAKVDQHARAIQVLIDGLVEEAATFGMSREAIALRTLELHGATRAQVEFTRALFSTIGELETAARITELITQANKDFDAAQRQVWADAAANVDYAAAKAEGFGGKIKEVKRETEDASRSAERFAITLGRGFEDAILHGRGLRDVLSGIAADLASMIFQMAVMGPLTEALSGLFGGLFGGASGGIAGKAAGGPVEAGRVYPVGERGPELFVPNAAGTIIPNTALAGGTEIHYHIDARGADAAVEHRVMRALAAMQTRTVAASLRAAEERALRS